MLNHDALNIFGIPLLLLLIVVVVMDFKYRKFKNIVFIAGIILIYFSLFKNDVIFHFLSAFLAGLMIFIFYLKNYVAAGDVKFSFLVGLLFGFSKEMVLVFSIASLISLTHSLIFLWLSGNNFKLDLMVFSSSNRKGEILYWMKSIPYAGYLAVSTILCMLCIPKP